MAIIKRVGPEILVNTTGGLHHQPTITGRGGVVNESVLIAWSSSNDNQLRGQWLEAVGGSKQGEDFLIATSTTAVPSKPAIHGLPFPGGFIAVWLDEGAHAVKGQRYAVDGSKVGDEFLVGKAAGEGTLKPAILSLPNSNIFVVAWTGHGAGSSTLDLPRPWVQIFKPDGTSLGSFPVNTTIGNNNPFHWGPEITWLADGNFVVAWTHERAIGGPRVLAQIFNPDGSKSGGEFKVNKSSVPRKGSIAVTGLNNGRFVGAWVVEEPTVSTVRAQIFNPDGSSVDDFELFITTGAQGRCSNPALTALSGGGFVAAWTEKSATSGDPSGNAVRAQLFTADGDEDRDKILVNTTTTGDQFGSTMTPSFNNHFVVAWVSDENPADNNMSVRAQVFRVS